MRLTLINQFYTPDVSPTAHLCASLAEHRAGKGDRVTVLTSRTGYLGAVSPRHADANVTVRRLWSTTLGSRTKLRRLLDWVTFFVSACWAAATMPRQDIVIAMTTPPFIALAGWLHKLVNPSARLILWNMDVYPEAIERTKLATPDGVVSRVMRSANRAIFLRLSHLVALDDAMADLLLSRFTGQNGTVPHTVIPNWEPMDLFPGEPIELLEISPGEKFTLLYLGNAGYGHEFQTVIGAAEVLREDPVIFRFVGGGALRPWLVNECRRRRLANFAFDPYVAKELTPALMRCADAALITLEDPMLGVMSPSKLHSNLAMGLPIIYVGPRGGNVDAAIRRFGCGVSLRPGDFAGIAAFIRRLLSQSRLRAELRCRARFAFDEAYCDRKALPRFDRVIDEALEAGSHDRGPTVRARTGLRSAP